MDIHRKVELQSTDDLLYLVTNVRSAATAHLNEAFPPADDQVSQGDDLRARIEAEVDEASLVTPIAFAKLANTHDLRCVVHH